MTGSEHRRSAHQARHRLLALGRFLGFAALFVAVFLTAASVLPVLTDVPTMASAPVGALVVQGTLLLGAAVVAGRVMLALEGRSRESREAADLSAAPGVPGATGATGAVSTDTAAPRAPGFGVRAGTLREVGLGLVAGAAGVLAVVAALAVAGVYRFSAEPGTLAGWAAVAGGSLLAFALPAAAEEAVFRGYALRTLREAGGVWPAVMATSLMFALAHGANPDVGGLALVNIFLAGVVLAVAVLRTGTLWFASAAHLGWNWVMAGPLDLPVSGLDLFDAPFYDGRAAGPAWLSGGPFGPEGGLAGTMAAAVVLGLIVLWTRTGAESAPTDQTGEGEGWLRSTG